VVVLKAWDPEGSGMEGGRGWGIEHKNAELGASSPEVSRRSARRSPKEPQTEKTGHVVGNDKPKTGGVVSDGLGGSDYGWGGVKVRYGPVS